jgi:hypothetical protein
MFWTHPAASVGDKVVSLGSTTGKTRVGEVVSTTNQAGAGGSIVLVAKGGRDVVSVLGSLNVDPASTAVVGGLHVYVGLVVGDVEALHHAGALGGDEADEARGGDESLERHDGGYGIMANLKGHWSELKGSGRPKRFGPGEIASILYVCTVLHGAVLSLLMITRMPWRYHFL